MKRNAVFVMALVVVSFLLALCVEAAEFMGFDPLNFKGEMLPAETLKAMVQEAMKVTPPRNGKNYVFAFANLQRDITFCMAVEEGIKKNCEAAGIELVIADNRLSGPTALANAESFITRNVDFVIEFQTDVNFGPVIMQKFNAAKIPVIAIDIPMPGATFFGVNNPYAGFLGGSYLAHAAIAKWGLDQVKKGYLVVGELPQSGVVPAMRTEGQVAGFLAVVQDFPKDHIILFDTKNTLEYSRSQMVNVLARIPEGVPIMCTAINCQSSTGIVRALQFTKRDKDAIVVGLGCDETGQEELAKEGNIYVADPASFPERYGNYLIPAALMKLAGYDLPEGIFVQHVIVTPTNLCEYYPKWPCQTPQGYPEVKYEFPKEGYNKFLAELREKYKEYAQLIPKDME